MAVTGHYIDKNKRSAVVLMAFRFIDGSHTGVNIGEHLFGVFKEFDILHKVISFVRLSEHGLTIMLPDWVHYLR